MSDARTVPAEEFTPDSEGELQRFVAENAEGERKALFPVGGRTALYGEPATDGVTIVTSGLDSVVDYPARDMTITVGAGIRMRTLQDRLATERQRLPLDVPQSRRATLGGVLATNTSGPRRFGHGTIRDHVIGIAAVDGRGRLFHAGGRVVKNVAGYDFCKMLVGSLGTLAVVSTVTLKLRPLPEATSLVWATCNDWSAADAALEGLLQSATRPVVVDLLDPAAAKEVATELPDLPLDGKPILVLGFDGADRSVKWECDAVRNELRPHARGFAVVQQEEDAQTLLDALTEFPTPSESPLVFKASVPPSRTIEFLRRAVNSGCAVQSHAGNGIVYGHLPDDVTEVVDAWELLAVLRTLMPADGHLVVHGGDIARDPRLEPFGTPRPAWPLVGKLKQTFDPHDVLNPGRCPDGFAATAPAAASRYTHTESHP